VVLPLLLLLYSMIALWVEVSPSPAGAPAPRAAPGAMRAAARGV
jgi:hypothetical protein